MRWALLLLLCGCAHLQPSPAAASCGDACAHADAVCPGSGNPCTAACPRVGAAYAACVNAAGSCDALSACGS